MATGQLTHDELNISTAPPKAKGLRRVLRSVRETASVVMLPLMQHAARAYVGGAKLEDALTVAGRFAGEGFPSTLALWNSIDASAQKVADEYVVAMERVAAEGLDSYLSIKPPALRYDPKLAAELALQAHKYGVRLHSDSHGPEVVDATIAMQEAMLAHLDPGKVSMTIPGRWSRSLKDAQWAVDRGCKVRVVKGEWPDPTEPNKDMASGFLDVIDQLAGRASHVAVGSHNVPLATEAIRRLRSAGTSCELELLFGLPMTQSLEWARTENVPVRVYVPYGAGYIPHAINQLRRKPQIAWWIVKDILTVRLKPANR